MTGVPPSFWARWSLRDLRAHWVAVVAIAVVIAIGTGVYAGLSSTSTWRRLSNDASFAALEMHDLRLTLSPGTFIEQGELLGAIASIDDAESVHAAAERLVVDSQVDTGSLGLAESVLVPARLVGMTFGSTQPVVRTPGSASSSGGAFRPMTTSSAPAWVARTRTSPGGSPTIR